jgi:uncharacterized membrane protein YkoI
MKKIFLVFMLGSLMIHSQAQKVNQNNVPAIILNAFKLEFGNATDVDWRLEKGNYRVDFEINDRDNRLIIDNRGKIVKHQQDLWVSEIPLAVLETIRKKVPLFDLEDADKITENGKSTYEINFEIDNKDHDFWINERGNLLKYKKELKRSEIPEPIWSHIKVFGKLDVEHAERTEENGKVVFWVDGDINHMEHDFYFTEKPKLIKHEQELRKNEIPAVILTTIKTKYPAYEIRDVELREEGSAAFYIIQLRKSKERITLTFNRKGELKGSVKKP